VDGLVLNSLCNVGTKVLRQMVSSYCPFQIKGERLFTNRWELAVPCPGIQSGY
jgi:hypothetical protein